MRSTYIISLSLILGILFQFSCETADRESTDGFEVPENKNWFSKLFSKEESLNAVELIHWVDDQDNGLKNSESEGEYTYTAFYKPLDYVILKGLDTISQLNKESYKGYLKEYNGMQYFTFTIERKEGGNKELLQYDLHDQQEYYSRIEYYSFSVQNDFMLIDGNDTLPCKLSHFERTYGIQSKATILLGFELGKEATKNKKHSLQEKILMFNDRVFGGGILKFRFDKETLDRIPSLRIG